MAKPARYIIIDTYGRKNGDFVEPTLKSLQSCYFNLQLIKLDNKKKYEICLISMFIYIRCSVDGTPVTELDHLLYITSDLVESTDTVLYSDIITDREVTKNKPILSYLNFTNETEFGVDVPTTGPTRAKKIVNIANPVWREMKSADFGNINFQLFYADGNPYYGTAGANNILQQYQLVLQYREI